LKEQIENHLKSLLLLPLKSYHRSADIVELGFGEWVDVTIRDKKRHVNEFVLHIQCSWRLVESNKIFVGSNDMYKVSPDKDYTDEELESFDYDKGNRCDYLFDKFFQGHKMPVVKSVHGDELGGATLFLSNNCILELFPDSSEESEYNEYWRIFKPGNLESHFVVSGLGIER
jgi:hypothetical protein